jgi:PqqD family protein of HPr-rel-A system
VSTHPARRADIEIEPVADGYVVYDPRRDRVHHLNRTAAFVLELCDGERTAGEIAGSLQAAYGLDEPVDRHVAECLEHLRREGLVLDPAG